MLTMDYHLQRLSHELKAGRRAAADILHHFERIRSTASDIVSVFQIDAKPFANDATNRQNAVTKALPSDPKICPAWAAAIKPIGQPDGSGVQELPPEIPLKSAAQKLTRPRSICAYITQSPIRL